MAYPDYITIRVSMDARSRPDFSGNKMGMYYSGRKYQVFGESDLCYKVSTANHWMLKSNCNNEDTVPDDEVPIPPVYEYPPSVELALPDGHGGNQPSVIYDRRT